jgi:hypothetical protein
MKAKVIGIAAVAIMMVMLIQYFLLPAPYREQTSSASVWPVMFAIAGGLVIGLFLATAALEKLLAGRPFDFLSLASTAPRGARVGTYVFALLALPVSLVLGFVVGGNFGGGFGGQIGDSGTVIGIGIGICIVTSLTVVTAGFLGFIVGGLAHRFVKKRHPSS